VPTKGCPRAPRFSGLDGRDSSPPVPIRPTGPSSSCRIAPITAEDLRGPEDDPSAPDDPTILPTIVPPEGFIGDPDGEGIIHAECATRAEKVEWLEGYGGAWNLIRAWCAGPEGDGAG
jgi:hypothetical protein